MSVSGNHLEDLFTAGSSLDLGKETVQVVFCLIATNRKGCFFNHSLQKGAFDLEQALFLDSWKIGKLFRRKADDVELNLAASDFNPVVIFCGKDDFLIGEFLDDLI